MLSQIKAPATVFWDLRYKGIWWNVKRAWMTYPRGITHKIVMSDDLEFCPDFIETLYRVVETRPDHILSIYTPTRFAVPTYEKGKHWLLRNAIGGPTILMPLHKVIEFLRWDETYNDPNWDPSHRGKPEGDDLRVCMWMKATGQSAWYTVPSLVQHTDIKSNFGGSAGRNSHVFFKDKPLKDLDWSIGLENPTHWTYQYSPKELEMFKGKKTYV